MNINGTYTSEDGNFVLVVQNSNESNGTFNGTYTAAFTPQGKQSFTVNGSWAYVANPGGGLTPLALCFFAGARPEARPWCLMDSWSGVMPNPESLNMVGVRSYVPGGQPSVLSDLGTHSFARS